MSQDEALIAPMGALAFRRGIQAWSAETGTTASPAEPGSEAY